MCGYTASYNGNTLSLQFNNPPSGIAGARIVIDPGHGGTDVGALGFYPGKHEDYVNRQIATELAASAEPGRFGTAHRYQWQCQGGTADPCGTGFRI